MIELIVCVKNIHHTRGTNIRVEISRSLSYSPDRTLVDVRESSQTLILSMDILINYALYPG